MIDRIICTSKILTITPFLIVIQWNNAKLNSLQYPQIQILNQFDKNRKSGLFFGVFFVGEKSGLILIRDKCLFCTVLTLLGHYFAVLFVNTFNSLNLKFVLCFLKYRFSFSTMNNHEQKIFFNYKICFNYIVCIVIWMNSGFFLNF